MEKIAWGIIGTGWIANRFAQALNSLDDARIVAVSSRNFDRANSFKSPYKIERAYDNHSDLVNDPNVDVVYVATPHHTHFATMLLALNAGKAVLCEKPFTMNGKEARTVADLAKEKNLFCMEAMWTRFLPLYRNLKTIIAEADLGEQIALRCEFGRPVPFDPKGRFFDPSMGGGSLLDLGVYGVSIATLLFGAPMEIQSVASIGKTKVDEQCFVSLKYQQGFASLTSSFRNFLSNDAHVFCTQGGFRICPLFIESEKLELWHLSTDSVPTVSIPSYSNKKHKSNFLTGLLQSYFGNKPGKNDNQEIFSTIDFAYAHNRYSYQAMEVMHCLREGLTESQILPLSESVLVMDILDRIRESWHSG